jgi:hypothetical protein
LQEDGERADDVRDVEMVDAREDRVREDSRRTMQENGSARGR